MHIIHVLDKNINNLYNNLQMYLGQDYNERFN